MLSFRAAVLLWVAGAAAAALRPLDADIRPAGNRAVVVYKTTPQGELKVNLYFRPDWRAADRRPAMIFFGGSCAPEIQRSLQPPRSTSRAAGWSRPRRGTESKAYITRRQNAARKMARAPRVGCG